MLKKGETVVVKKTPDHALPDEQLIQEGKMKALFEIVAKRPKKQWDEATKTRRVLPKIPANFSDPDYNAQVALMQENCIGTLEQDGFKAYIVRYGENKQPDGSYLPCFGVQVFDGKQPIDSYYLNDLDDLIEGLKKDLKRKSVPQKKTAENHAAA